MSVVTFFLSIFYTASEFVNLRFVKSVKGKAISNAFEKLSLILRNPAYMFVLLVLSL